jgi:hypothetical protein
MNGTLALLDLQGVWSTSKYRQIKYMPMYSQNAGRNRNIKIANKSKDIQRSNIL